jgi:hypothetical protein
MIVTKDLISGRLVRLLDARDSQGKTFLEALADIPEEQKRQCRNALRASAGLPIPEIDRWPIN